jgi:hypothetical protein
LGTPISIANLLGRFGQRLDGPMIASRYIARAALSFSISSAL